MGVGEDVAVGVGVGVMSRRTIARNTWAGDGVVSTGMARPALASEVARTNRKTAAQAASNPIALIPIVPFFLILVVLRATAHLRHEPAGCRINARV